MYLSNNIKVNVTKHAFECSAIPVLWHFYVFWIIVQQPYGRPQSFNVETIRLN